MKPLTVFALIALSLLVAACSDRGDTPVEPAMPEAVTTPAPAPAAPADPAAAPANTGACEGLTGQALSDCLNFGGPISAPPTTVDPATTEPTLTDSAATNDTGRSADPATPPQP